MNIGFLIYVICTYYTSVNGWVKGNNIGGYLNNKNSNKGKVIKAKIQETDWNNDIILRSLTSDGEIVEENGILNKKRNAIALTYNNIGLLLSRIFLPIGYPNSVPSEYTRFQTWNIIQDACSYLRGIMATRAVLAGMGVGDASVTAIQATVQWILRDGASMLGGLLFTSLSSANFGQNVKSR